MASYHRKAHSVGSDTDAVVLVFVILLACSFWEHKALVLKIEHTVWCVLVSAAALFLGVLLVKFNRKVLRRTRHSVYDMRAIDNMDGLEFERCVAQLLEAQGYGAVRLTEEYDYGVDIIAVKNGITWGIQVKRYSGLVKANAVRQVVTALKVYHCDRAMVVTNSYYSEVAKRLAHANDCSLVGRIQLEQWLMAKRQITD